MPIAEPHTGLVALATYTDGEIERMMTDLQRRDYPGAPSTPTKILSQVQAIREQRVSCGYDVYVKGIGIVAFPVRSQMGAWPYIGAVAGPIEGIKDNESKILETIRQALGKHEAHLGYPR